MKSSDVKHLVAFHSRYVSPEYKAEQERMRAQWSLEDEQIHAAESFQEADFAVEVDDAPPSEPAHSFFSHIYRKGESSWGVIVGIRWDAVESAWYYQLDTDYDEWVIEDEIEVHVLRGE